MAKTSISAYITRMIGGNKTDNPKIFPQTLTDGRVSLYLLYYLGYTEKKDPVSGKITYKEIRQKKTLKLFLCANPRTAKEREHNRQTVEIAKKMRYEAEQQMKERETGYRVKKEKKVDFLQYYREYIDNYTKKDIRNIRISYSRFVDFLHDTPKYKTFSKGIKPNQIDRDMITAFVEYIQKRSYGEGANTIYKRFKKVVKHAVEHDVMLKNPCMGITIKNDPNALTKDVLSIEEIRTLASTPYPRNRDTAQAFMFCLLTGLRWCDVKNLTFANVDYSNRVLSFSQQKTEGHSAHSAVTIPLSDDMLSLIGAKGERTEKVFDLPSYEAACKSVKGWISKAGIEKHISWHCARHSFAVNVLSNGADIKTVSSLLGHSSIAMTEKYLHVVDGLKRAAIDNFPSLNINAQPE